MLIDSPFCRNVDGRFVREAAFERRRQSDHATGVERTLPGATAARQKGSFQRRRTLPRTQLGNPLAGKLPRRTSLNDRCRFSATDPQHTVSFSRRPEASHRWKGRCCESKAQPRRISGRRPRPRGERIVRTAPRGAASEDENSHRRSEEKREQTSWFYHAKMSRRSARRRLEAGKTTNEATDEGSGREL